METPKGLAIDSVLIRADDGTRLQAWLQRYTGASAPTCLLLHGFGDGAYVWADTFAALRHVCPVVAVDLRGHGDSGPSQTGSYDLATSVADVVELITVLDPASVIVVGHSLGGEIVLRLGARAGGGLAGAVFVDMCPQANQEASRQATVLMRESMRTYGSIDE